MDSFWKFMIGANGCIILFLALFHLIFAQYLYICTPLLLLEAAFAAGGFGSWLLSLAKRVKELENSRRELERKLELLLEQSDKPSNQQGQP